MNDGIDAVERGGPVRLGSDISNTEIALARRSGGCPIRNSSPVQFGDNRRPHKATGACYKKHLFLVAKIGRPANTTQLALRMTQTALPASTRRRVPTDLIPAKPAVPH